MRAIWRSDRDHAHRRRQPEFGSSPRPDADRTRRPALGRVRRDADRLRRRSRTWTVSASPGTCTISISTSWRAAFMAKPLGYDGVISGPLRAEGSMKNPAATGGARGSRDRARRSRRAGLRQAERGLQRPRRHRDAGEILPGAAAHAHRSLRSARASASTCAPSRAIWRISGRWREICR